MASYDAIYYAGALSEIFNDVDYSVALCEKCDHLFYGRKLSDTALSKMYTAHARHKRKKSQQVVKENHPKGQRIHRLILKGLYASCKESARLLDFGAGAGVWSRIARDTGFEVTAYEPHGVRVDKAVSFTHDWREITGQKYDVVLCNQVLEHVADPHDVLCKIRSVCHEESLLFCTVPNAGRRDNLEQIKDTWPFDGKKNHILAPFQHLHGYSQKSFLRLHLECGFTVKLFMIPKFGEWGLKSLVAFFLGRLHRKLSLTGFIFKPILTTTPASK